MNATTVKKIILGLGLAEGTFHVKGERGDRLRFFTVTLHNEADHGRASDIKAAVVAKINASGLGGGCDVYPQVNPLGKKLA